MAEPTVDQDLHDFLEVRQPGAALDELKRDDFAIQLGVDLENYKKFPRVDDSVTYPKVRFDTRAEIVLDTDIDLPDYSGPFRRDLRFSDFSREALVRMIAMSHEYYVLLVDSWAEEVANRVGHEQMQEIQTSVWPNGVTPHLKRIVTEWGALPDVDVMPELGTGAVSFNPFAPDDRYEDLEKEALVNLALGSHEFLL